MKTRTLRIGLCIALCLAALCLCAFAAEPQTATPDANGVYTVSYTGTAGEYYALLIVSGTYTEAETPTISEDTIIYISQATADSEGVAAFTNFKPKDMVDGTIYIGGSDLDKAVLYGYLDDGVVSDATVSGTVTSESAKEATVTLTSTTDTEKVYTVTTTDGAYTVSVPLDTYKFVVTKAAHLSYTKNELVVEADTTKDVALMGGDTNADDVVNELDLGSALTAFNTASDDLDINGDGVINEVDLGKLLTNFSLTSVVE